MTQSAEKTTRESITWIKSWTPHLFSFRITRPKAFRFTAGQFARLGVEKADGDFVWRAYSMVSNSYDEFLEFYSIVVPQGEFTSELSRLRVGDRILIEKQNHGFLTLDRFSAARDLWLLSTGTGIAPFRSFLRERAASQAPGRNWLFYGHQRQATDFFYKDELNKLKDDKILTDWNGLMISVATCVRSATASARPAVTEQPPVRKIRSTRTCGVAVKKNCNERATSVAPCSTKGASNSLA